MDTFNRLKTHMLTLTLLVFAGTWMSCVSRPVGPELKEFMPRVERDDDLLDEFKAVVELTVAVDRLALRRIPLKELVDTEIKAMIAYVKERGRGELESEQAYLTGDQVVVGDRKNYEIERLVRAALRLMPFLSLDTGPMELSRAAVTALHEKLGDDATYLEAKQGLWLAGGGLTFEMREGVGYLSIRLLDESIGDRVWAILNQWGLKDPQPRAVVLDLSRCETGTPTTAAALVNVFAPGKKSFELNLYNEKTGQTERREWRGEAGGSSALYTRVPVFVVMSAHTGALGEAIARALRHHRTARIIGAATGSNGRIMVWFDLPWKAHWGFVAAEVIGVDGKALRSNPVIPDICSGDTGLVALTERTMKRYREQCSGTEGTIHGEVVVNHVIALLAQEETGAGESADEDAAIKTQ